jgi:tripartite-type tricarboxylate transporter receptor subunit TctC
MLGRRQCFITATLAVLLAASGAGAQDFPSRPVKIIVPFPAGGTADVMPRVFGEWLSRKWGQPVVIENRTGAAGNIGAEAVAKAEPDGYTLLSAPPPPLVINHNLYPKLGFDPTAFVPIVIMGRVPNALVVNAKRPETSVAELIATAKANPGKSPRRRRATAPPRT